MLKEKCYSEYQRRYDEYHADDDALYEKIIDTFYQPEE